MKGRAKARRKLLEDRAIAYVGLAEYVKWREADPSMRTNRGRQLLEAIRIIEEREQALESRS